MSIKTMKLRIAFTLLFTCLLFPTFAQSSTNLDLSDAEKEHLSAKGRVTMCVDPNWMPYERIDEQGKHEGIAADFMSEFQKGIPVPIELVLTESWKESLEAAKSRQCDILSLLNESPQRREFLNFTDPYLTDSVVIVVRNDVFYLEGLESLSGRKLGIVEGYVYEEKIRKQYPEIKIISVKSVGDALRKVSDGEIYASLDALFIITRHIQELGLSNLKIVGQTGLDNAFRVGVRKDDPILLSVFDKIIKNLDDETRNAILGRWYTVKFQHGTDWRVVWQVTGIAIIILCLLGYNTLLTRRFNRKLSEANDLLLNKNQELDKGNIELRDEITQRKKAEEALQQEKDRFAKFLDIAGVILLAMNADQEVILMNKKGCGVLGYSHEEIIGKNWFDNFLPERLREEVVEVYNKLVAGEVEPVEDYENPVLIKSGEERLIAWHNVVLYDEQGKFMYTVSSGEDITERKQMENDLLKAKKLESVAVLAGGIAHDFNNILTGILGNISLALFEADLSDRTKQFLSEAEKASLRAKDLTQQLLTFAKGGEPVRKTSSLESVIKDSANFVLHGDKVACHHSIPEDLWLVDIDKGQVSQVIQNIVLNASHAMPEGGTVNVTCSNVSSGDIPGAPLLHKGKFVKISIQDSGIGMTANVVDKIFDPYFSTKHDGSGLGLAITHSIVIKHDGHISVESSPDIGTTFTIYLPASEKTEALTQKTEVDKKAFTPARILIMDDEEIVKTVAKEMLIQLGHEAEFSENGNEAIRLYQEAINTNNTFDLVIMDLTIPGGMGGKEAVQEILNIDPNAKVIVSSGYSNDPIMANFKDYGFCSAIIKPYRLQELSKVISQILD